MTADVELLPLPGDLKDRIHVYVDNSFARPKLIALMQDYARANVAHATSALNAEIEALRAERDLFRDETIELVRQNGEWQARTERLAGALDIIARVGKASRNLTARTRWIVARAVSALNGDDDWQALPKPKGFHDALLRPTAAQENDDA